MRAGLMQFLLNGSEITSDKVNLTSSGFSKLFNCCATQMDP